MAYQKVQFGFPRRPIDLGAPSIFQAIKQRRDEGRAADERVAAQAEERFNKRRAGYTNALMQAQAFLDKGDIQTAQALLAPYVGGMQEVASGPPPSASPVTPAAQPVAGGSAAPDQLDGGRSVGSPGERIQYPTDTEEPERSVPAFTVGGPSIEQLMQQAAPLGAAVATGRPPADAVDQILSQPANPIMAARQGQQAQRARTVLQYFDPMGNRVTLDPEARRQEALRRQDEETNRILGVSDGLADPEDQNVYRAALLTTRDPELAMRIVEQRRSTREALRVKEQDYQRNRADRIEDRDFQAKEAKERAHIAASAARARQNDKPLTDPERKAGAAAARLDTLLADYDRIKPPDDNTMRTIMSDVAREAALEKSPLAKAALIETGRYTPLGEKLTPQARSYINQMKEIAAVILRKESGATITASELEDVIQRYSRQPGDTPADLAQKRKNLGLAVEAIRGETRLGDAAVKGAMPDKNAERAARKKGGGKKPSASIDELVDQAMKK